VRLLRWLRRRWVRGGPIAGSSRRASAFVPIGVPVDRLRDHALKTELAGVLDVTRQETAACGAKPNGSTARSSSSSAGRTRKDRVLISARCC
jgi:hypothetical protein